jgi:D-3-phosphoglycerate dehydrogenase
LGQANAVLVVAEKGDEDELSRLAVDVDGILTCWKPVTQRVLEQAGRCRSVGRYGIGLDNIDVTFATSAGIVVTNVPSFCLEEVSDHAMALLLSWARKTTFYDRQIKAGTYNLQGGSPLFRIAGKTLGIVGFGKIARTLYTKASGFRLKVISYDPYLDPQSLQGFDVEFVGFDTLLERSDYISIHAPLTPETRHLFDLKAFRRMKRTAIIINTARGDLIDSVGLLQALDEGEIEGAGIDVLSQEPPDLDDPLINHPKTIVTPHAAFSSKEAVLDLQQTAATQMAQLLSGRLPDNVVNPEVLDQSNLRAVFQSGTDR